MVISRVPRCRRYTLCGNTYGLRRVGNMQGVCDFATLMLASWHCIKDHDLVPHGGLCVTGFRHNKHEAMLLPDGSLSLRNGGYVRVGKRDTLISFRQVCNLWNLKRHKLYADMCFHVLHALLRYQPAICWLSSLPNSSAHQ